MENLQASEALVLRNAFLPNLLREHQVTKNVIAAVPTDQGGYRPDSVSKSAMELSWHMASAEIRFLEAVIAGEFDLTPRPQPDTIQNSADLAAWYGEQFERCRAGIEGLSGEQLAKSVDFRGMFQLPAVMYIDFNLRHIIHHRGQLSTYLRPTGAKVPAIYGESYDSAAARKAAQA